MGNLFSSKKQTPEYSTVYDPFSKVRGQTSDWLSSQIGQKAEPYTGKLVEGMSAPETESLDWLKKYTQGGPSEMTGLGQAEIKKTLTGEYDPTTSPYYMAVKAESARNLAETQQNVADKAAGGGRYWGGARLEQQREAGTDVANALNTMLGGMSERERQNRLGAATTAAQMGEAEQNIPLQKAMAGQQLGALPREIGTAQNQAIYNEWIRQQNYPKEIAQMAQPYATYEPTMAEESYAPSLFQQLSPLLGEGAKALGSYYQNKQNPKAGKNTSSSSSGGTDFSKNIQQALLQYLPMML